MSAPALKWPENPFRIVLVEPEIPPNTGNIARLCAATGSPLHLIEPLGFPMTDRHLKRAGLDYWDSVTMFRHPNFETFEKDVKPARLFFFSASGERNYMDVKYQPGDAFVFGGESKGLPREMLRSHSKDVLLIPIIQPKIRSLNLATAVGIVLYEALRQLQRA